MMDLYIVENGILYLHFTNTGHTFYSGNIIEVSVMNYLIQSNLALFTYYLVIFASNEFVAG